MSNQSLHSLTSSVTALNNQAVAQIQNGEYVSAISSLSFVFNTCKGLLSSCRVSRRQQQGNRNGNVMAPAKTSYCTFSNEVDQGKIDSQGNGTDSLFFCRRPLMLVDPCCGHATRMTKSSGYPPFQEQQCPEAMTDFAEFATYAIIYNLALCHHLQADGMQSSKYLTGKSKSLRRALALYSCARDALHLVLKNPVHTSSSIHTVVLLNNMVHASQGVGDEESARRCLHSLATTAMTLLAQRRNKQSSLSHPFENETDEFTQVGIVLDRIVTNLAFVLFGKRGCCTAPAA